MGAASSPVGAAYQLAYVSSREDAGDRATRRADRLRARLDWEPGILNGGGEKPKWMRLRMFERLAAKHDALVDDPIAQDRRSIDLRFGPMLGFQQSRPAPIRGYQTRRTGNNRFVASVEGRRLALNFDSSPCRATANRNENATRRLSNRT
jgi:hypothetical protein